MPVVCQPLRRLWLLAGLLLASLAAAEDMQLQILTLKHRLVEEVIPVLQPLLASGGTVSGMNNQIIVRTTSRNLDELRQVLARIDSVQRRFRIYVRQDRSAQNETTGGKFSTRMNEEGVGTQYRSYDTRSGSTGTNMQFVQTVEGQPAFIATGKAMPLPNQTTIIGPGGASIIGGIQYRDVTSGFDVVPRAVGNKVTLSISPHNDELARNGDGTIAISFAQSTVSGRLGEWMDLGGSDQDFRNDDDGVLHSTRRYGTEVRGLSVMVEEIR